MSEHEFWKDLGNIFDAVLNYQKKNVEFNNRFINPWIRLGNVFEHDDQANIAVEAYKRATELDPDNAQNWAELGDAQFKKAAYDDAVSAYQKSIALDPEAGWPIGNLALTMVTQGNVEEAIPLYLNSIELLSETKDKAVCWNRLGNAYRKLNDYENAFHAFQQADQLDGDNTGFNDKLDETQPNTVVIAPEEILEQLIVEQSLEDAVAESSMELEAPSETITQPEAELESLPSVQVQADDELVALVPEEIVEVKDEASAAVVETDLEEDESPLTLHENDFDILKVVEEVIAKVEEEFSAREDSELAAEEIAVEMDLPIENERSAQEVELVAALHEEIVVDEESATSAAAELEIVSEEITQEAELVAAIHEEMMDENELVASAVAELEIVSEELIQKAELVAAIHEEIVAENESVTSEVAELDIVREEVIQEVISVAEASEEIAAEVEPAVSEVVAVEEINEETISEVESVANMADDIHPLRKIPAWLVVTNMVLEKLGLEETPEFVNEPAAEKLVEAEAVLSESAADMDIVETYTNSFALPAMLDANLNEESVSEIADPLEVQNDALTESSASLESVVTENVSMSVVEEQVTELAYEEYLKDVIEPIQILPDHVDAVQGEAPLTRVSQNGEVRIAMDTKNAHVWNELGNVYLNSGACEDAISSYSKAIDLDRHFAWPYSNLAFAYVHKGRFAEAILLYQRSIELFVTDKDKAVTWNRLGNVYRRINDYSNAIAAYHTADELDPENTTLSLRTSFGLLGNMQSDSKPAYVE